MRAKERLDDAFFEISGILTQVVCLIIADDLRVRRRRKEGRYSQQKENGGDALRQVRTIRIKKRGRKEAK